MDLTTSHHDPLVITPIIKRRNDGHVRLHGVLVDIGALVDIFYWNAFVQLRLGEYDLTPYRVPVWGFRKTKVLVAGMVTVSVILGKGGQTRTMQVKFTVVRINSWYNTILGRIILHVFKQSCHPSTNA